MTTLLGTAVYERAYYYCATCRAGDFPTDAEFGLARRQTPGAREVITLMGVLEPFEEGAHAVLPRLSGMNVSPSTVQRTTEAEGHRFAERRAEGATCGPNTPWHWHRDVQGRSVAYTGLDATGVRQQGPHGEKADGRLPWVGTVFNPQAAHEKRRRQRVWDFWHVTEHLQEFANLFLADDELRKKQLTAWCHRLKHAGGQAVLKTLESLNLARAAPAVRESHRQLLGYFRSNLHRMNYPQYVANGWHIGSGKIESACKSVVGGRLKGPGMRWHEPGTTALCQLRSLYKSQPACWQHYWNRTVAT